MKGNTVLGIVELYLIIINIVGFFVFAIDMWFYNYTNGEYTKQIDKAVTIVSLMGGSLGILIGILLFCRVLIKPVMMSRVFVVCVFVIELIIYLIYKGFLVPEISFSVQKILSDYKILIIYLIIMNIITFIIYGIDKWKAVEGKYRIRIVTLLGLAFAGGSLGAFVLCMLLGTKQIKIIFL